MRLRSLSATGHERLAPLNPAVTINVHNVHLQDLGGPFEPDANVFFLRGLFSMMIGETPNLVQFSLLVIAEPTIHGGNTSGRGHLVAFNVAVFEQDGWPWLWPGDRCAHGKQG